MRVYVDTETGEMVEALPSDVVGPEEPYRYADWRRAVMACTRETRQAIRDHETAVRQKARAQSTYRKLKAQKIIREKMEHGSTIAEAVAFSDEELVKAYEDRIIAEGLEKAAQERVRLCSEDRASLHRLGEWSRAANADGWE